MSNAFQRIADAMSKVVHRIDAPLVASLMMLGEFNAIQHRIAHHDKRRRHVDFSAQTGFTLFKTAGTHFSNSARFSSTLRSRNGLFTRRGQRTAVFTDLLRRQLINVGRAFIDQLDRIGVQLVKVIGGVANIARPVKA